MGNLRESQFLMEDGTMVTTEMIHDHRRTSLRGNQSCLELFLLRFWEQGDMVVGFETEWSFGVLEAQVSLLMLCSKGGCLLIKLDGCRMSYFDQLLKEFFANKDIVFAGIHIKKDVEKLEKTYGFEIRNVVDLSQMAAKMYNSPRLGALGVKDLVSAVLSPYDGHTNPFSAAQLAYRGAETLSEEKKIEHATAVAYAIYKTAKLGSFTSSSILEKPIQLPLLLQAARTLVSLPSLMPSSGPPINPDVLLARAFQSDQNLVKTLQARFWWDNN